MVDVLACVPVVLEELRRSHERALDQLVELLRIPSISADTAQRPAIRDAAQWVARAAANAGFVVDVIETDGSPVVIAEWRQAGGAAPTVLIYGHYDVQPADPLAEWDSDPFGPVVRGGRLYARGASDNKGQFYAHLSALQAWLTATGRLPVNMVLLVEGEEEIGSPNLASVIASHAHRLEADVIVISDGPMLGPGIPTIETSLRGYLGLQIDVGGATHELHSGEYGGAVVNPANVLCQMIAGLHDAHGRIAVPGFYDRVVEMTALERRALDSLPISEVAFRQTADRSILAGERGYSTFERLWRRPSCDVSGLISGYTGEGGKSVIPSWATAKVGFRLVPDQDPADIERLVSAHLSAAAPPAVALRLTRLATAVPWRLTGDHAVIHAAARAARRVFGREPVFVGGGGSIPAVPALAGALHVPVLLCGFGQPGENVHAPNEWLSIEHFRLGRTMSATLWAELASP